MLPEPPISWDAALCFKHLDILGRKANSLSQCKQHNLCINLRQLHLRQTITQKTLSIKVILKETAYLQAPPCCWRWWWGERQGSLCRTARSRQRTRADKERRCYSRSQRAQSLHTPHFSFQTTSTSKGCFPTIVLQQGALREPQKPAHQDQTSWEPGPTRGCGKGFLNQKFELVAKNKKIYRQPDN